MRDPNAKVTDPSLGIVMNQIGQMGSQMRSMSDSLVRLVDLVEHNLTRDTLEAVPVHIAEQPTLEAVPVSIDDEPTQPRALNKWMYRG